MTEATTATDARTAGHPGQQGHAGRADPWPGAHSLTDREQEILDLIAEGLTNRQIGAQLHLAEKTVKNYVSGLLAKLGFERRTQAAVYGAQHRRGTRRRARTPVTAYARRHPVTHCA